MDRAIERLASLLRLVPNFVVLLTVDTRRIPLRARVRLLLGFLRYSHSSYAPHPKRSEGLIAPLWQLL
jgi:hypothetical protein